MIKTRNLVKGILFSIIALNIGMEKLIDNTGFISNYTNLTTMILSIILYLWSVTSVDCRSTLKKSAPQVFSISAFYFIFLTIEIIWTSLFFNIDIFAVINNSRSYWCLLLLPSFAFIFIKFDISSILRQLFYIVLLIQLLRFSSWFSYNYTSFTLFPAMIGEYGSDWVRFDSKRILDTCLIGFELCYAVHIIFGNYKLSQKYFAFAVSVFCVVFAAVATASRSMVIVCVLSIALMYIFKKEMSLNILIKPLITICLFIAILYSEAYSKIIESFGVASDNYVSTVVRLDAFSYYMGSFEKTWFGGLGFSDGLSPQAIFLNHGILSQYYLNDLGFAGTIFKFGLFGIALITLYFVQGIKAIRKNTNSNQKILAIGLLIFFVTSGLLTNALFDVQRIFAAPIFMAIFVYINNTKRIG